MQMTLLRHGTRNYDIGDIPLNGEGLLEAKALSEDSRLAETTRIFCSPKKRAQMTVGPLSKEINVQIQTVESLDQQKTEETSSEFRDRVQKALDLITSQLKIDDSALICSHSDWLTLAAQLVPSTDVDLKTLFFNCATYRRYKIEDGLWLPQ